jgi:ferric-dicitrate binding protein FerR (iron transport regulator)
LLLYFSLHPEEQYFYEILSNYWQAHAAAEKPQEEHFTQLFALANTLHHNNEPSLHFIRKFKKPFLGYTIWSAAILLFAVVGYVFFLKPPHQHSLPQSHNEVFAKPGVKTQVILPDGTLIWLNSDSKLIYEHDFKEPTREVQLIGEAFFDVAKDASRPFIVHTSDIDIKVLGTAFNVKSYPQNEVIETTLLRGIIEVTKPKQPNSPKIILHPHEKLIFQKTLESNAAVSGQKDSVAITTFQNADIAVLKIPKNMPDSALTETSWVYNKLIFEGDTFKELAEKMERWYNVKIIFHNTQVASYRFRGVFENESLEEALEALQLTASFQYKINNHEVHIYK